MSGQPLVDNSSNVVAKAEQEIAQSPRDVLVELDSHVRPGIPGTGMSSSADAAANAIAARTCSN